MSKGNFSFDKNKCVGCHACVVGCFNENGLQYQNTWRNIYTTNATKLPSIPLFHLSLACNHCDDAPCMAHCPALAYERNSITYAVIHLADSCMGCKYCVWNCPYDAPKFNPAIGIVEKCNFCSPRQENGLEPACVMACPTGALDFFLSPGNESANEQKLPVQRNPKPAIRIVELRKESAPEMDLNLFKSIETAEKSGKRHFVGALHEWPLLAFTFILSALVALSVAGVGHQSAEWLKLVMVIAGFAGAMLSMMHLGKKTRMWRAVLNLKNSWLSREIFFFSLYFVAMITDFYFFNLHYYLVLIPGILTLFSIDMLYKPVQQKWRVPWHSGQTIFIALSLAFLFLLMPWYILGLWIFRVGLQLYFIVKNPLNLVKKSLIFVRWGLVDLAMIFYYFDLSMVWIIAIVMVSEFLDRILFYEDLELDSMSK